HRDLHSFPTRRSSDLEAMAWYEPNIKHPGATGWMALDDYSYEPRPVGTKQPNTWGLFDMHGNVDEWCADWYRPELPGGHVTDPVGPTSSSYALRTICGGNWRGYGGGAMGSRSAIRIGNQADETEATLGFRVALV